MKAGVPPAHIVFLNVVSCPEGLAALGEAYPEVRHAARPPAWALLHREPHPPTPWRDRVGWVCLRGCLTREAPRAR